MQKFANNQKANKDKIANTLTCIFDIGDASPEDINKLILCLTVLKDAILPRYMPFFDLGKISDLFMLGIMYEDGTILNHNKIEIDEYLLDHIDEFFSFNHTIRK